MADEDVTLDNFTVEGMGPEAPLVFNQAQAQYEHFSRIVQHQEPANQ